MNKLGLLLVFFGFLAVFLEVSGTEASSEIEQKSNHDSRMIEDDNVDEDDEDDEDESGELEERRRRGGYRKGRKRKSHRWGGHYKHKYNKHNPCGPFCPTCQVGEKLVRSYTTTTAGSAFTYKCVKEQFCFYDCTTVPCKKNCINKDTTVSKPGICPTIDCTVTAYFMTNFYIPFNPYSRRYPYCGFQSYTCSVDSQCKGEQKCCLLQPHNTKKCVDPVTTGDKCGTCPTTCIVNASFPDPDCTSDAQCAGGLKCCTCGTQKKCRVPTV